MDLFGAKRPVSAVTGRYLILMNRLLASGGASMPYLNQGNGIMGMLKPSNRQQARGMSGENA
jgi:hypothetical protein